MIRYFPFANVFDLKMGTSPMGAADTVIEIDEHYKNEVSLKRRLLQEDPSYYFQSVLKDTVAQWEVVEKIASDLVRFDPANFIMDSEGDRWKFENRLLGETAVFVQGSDASLPYQPLDWIGRQVQEDLIILDQKGHVVAGQLCFPSGWSVGEKIGKQFMEVHAPLPAVMDPMITAADKLLSRIPPHKPLSRNNWGFRLGDQLDMSSRHSAAYRKKIEDEVPALTMDDIGRRIFLRVEHQTLTRLTRSGYLLFTIHTYNSPLEEEARNEDRRKKMLGFLETVPPELIVYKVMTALYQPVLDFLRSNK